MCVVSNSKNEQKILESWRKKCRQEHERLERREGQLEEAAIKNREKLEAITELLNPSDRTSGDDGDANALLE